MLLSRLLGLSKHVFFKSFLLGFCYSSISYFYFFIVFILDNNLLINKFISREAAASCAYFVAGIVQGIIDAAGFVINNYFIPHNYYNIIYIIK